MFLRVAVFYVATLLFSGLLIAVQGFLVMTLSLSVVLGVVLQSARGTNLAVATVAHTVVNLSMFALFDEESGHAFPMVAMAAVTAVTAVITYRTLRPAAVAPTLVTSGPAAP